MFLSPETILTRDGAKNHFSSANGSISGQGVAVPKLTNFGGKRFFTFSIGSLVLTKRFLCQNCWFWRPKNLFGRTIVNKKHSHVFCLYLSENVFLEVKTKASNWFSFLSKFFLLNYIDDVKKMDLVR